MKSRLLLLCWLLLACFAAAKESAVDPAHRFLGSWAGPANVYDDLQIAKPTNAQLTISRASNKPDLYVVEMTVYKDQLMRFTKCRLADEGQLRVQDDLIVETRHIRVDGFIKSRDGLRLEEGYISLAVENENGDFRPYFTVKFAAKRILPAPTPAPEPPK